MKYHVIIKIYHWLAIQSKTKIDKVEFSFLFRFLHSYYETHLAKVYSQRNSFYDLILKGKKIAMMQTIIFLLSMWYFFQGGIISLIKYWKSQPTRRGNETLWIFFFSRQQRHKIKSNRGNSCCGTLASQTNFFLVSKLINGFFGFFWTDGKNF